MNDFKDIEALNAIEESECFIQIFQTTYEKSGLKLIDEENYKRNTTTQLVIYHNNTENFAKAMKSFLDSLVFGRLSKVVQTIDDDGEYKATIALYTKEDGEEE